MQIINKATTDVSLAIRLRDATNGSPKTGLTIANLQIRYIRVEDDNDVTISSWTSLTALANLTAAHTDNYGYEIGEGYYRIDIPDAVCATGASEAVVLVQDSVGSTVLVEAREIQLLRVDVGTVLGETPMSEADVNEQVDSALNTAIPSSTTAESINERLDATGAGGF